MTNPADQLDTAFLMRVEISMGGGLGVLPNGAFGPTRRMDLVGPAVRGIPPPAGTTVVIARVRQEPLTARVIESGTWPDGRVRVQLDDVLSGDVDGAYALSSDPTALTEMQPPDPQPGAPTPEDEFDDHQEPGVPYTWGELEELDVEIVVELSRHPTPDEAAALERAIRAWDHFGVVHGFGPAMFRGGPGYLHGLYTDERFGPRWNGATLRWLEDFGSANPEVAANDLARRLAGWSNRWGALIAHLEFGGPSVS